jgi:LL-diaminopimelate aminotransferase
MIPTMMMMTSSPTPTTTSVPSNTSYCASTAAAVTAAAAASSIQPFKGLPAPAKPTSQLPLYVFAQLSVLKQAVKDSGISLVDLGMGNPDMPTPSLIVDALAEAVRKPENHLYPEFDGKPEFRQAIANFMHRRHGVVGLNPNTQVQPLIGSKEGIANIILGYIDADSICLVPSLYYPVYMRATTVVAGTPYYMPLLEENNFLPDLDAIPADVLAKAKMLLLNYPNNPTGREAPRWFYEKAVAFARKHGLVLVSDLAYGEIAYDGFKPLSIFEIDGAMDVAVEFHSFSKTFNMAGFRLGFAVGNPEIIKTLYKAKTTIDYGVCNAIQDGGTVALNNAETLVPPIVAEYQKRRDYMVPQLNALGWDCTTPKGGFYLWLKVPPCFEGSSYAWVEYLMKRTGVVVTPGLAFGKDGDAYFRLSLVSPVSALKEAIKRMCEADIYYTMPRPTEMG